MNARVVGFRWRPAEGRLERAAKVRAAKLPQSFQTITDRRGVLLLLSGKEDAIVLPDDLGVLIGPMFRRAGGSSEPVSAIENKKAWAIAESGGALLIQNYWGGYLAILHDHGRDRLHLVRDPCGAGAVFHCQQTDGSTIFASCVDDLLRIEPTLSPDETMLTAFLTQPRLIARRTGLEGVKEVLPGCRLTLGRSERHEDCLWRPISQGKGLGFENGARALRDTLGEVASAWVRYASMLGRDAIAHRLSGGFDSAIVAAALCEAGGALQGFNEYPYATPEGDERRFAQSVAERYGFPLHVIEARAEAVDYAHMFECDLAAKPSHAQFSFADASLPDAISACGARLVTSGQGGDQILHRSRTAAIAADAVLDRAPWREAWRIIMDTARLIRAPAWTVLGEIAMALTGQHRFSPYNDAFQNPFANDGAAEAARREWAQHPWAEAMAEATPARALRMAHVADLQYYHQPSSLSAQFVCAPVIASQPIVELCLSIAPYVMTEGGAERALARSAFDASLPREIAQRRYKGDTTRYHLAVLERQIATVREALLDGELARRGLIGRARIEEAMKRDFIADARAKAGVMTAFAAEAWLQRLIRAKARAAAKA